MEKPMTQSWEIALYVPATVDCWALAVRVSSMCRLLALLDDAANLPYRRAVIDTSDRSFVDIYRGPPVVGAEGDFRINIIGDDEMCNVEHDDRIEGNAVVEDFATFPEAVRFVEERV